MYPQTSIRLCITPLLQLITFLSADFLMLGFMYFCIEELNNYENYLYKNNLPDFELKVNFRTS